MDVPSIIGLLTLGGALAAWVLKLQNKTILNENEIRTMMGNFARMEGKIDDMTDSLMDIKIDLQNKKNRD